MARHSRRQAGGSGHNPRLAFKPTEAEIETVCRVIYEQPDAAPHIMARWDVMKNVSPPLRKLVREQAMRVLKWQYDLEHAKRTGLL